MNQPIARAEADREVHIPTSDGGVILGTLSLPPAAQAVVLFIHDAGSDRNCARNLFVAHALRSAGFGTLLLDLSPSGLRQPALTTQARRVLAATRWLGDDVQTRSLPVVYFGGGTGAAIALLAAAEQPLGLSALISRGGRTDFALPEQLAHVQVPSLFLVGSLDQEALALNSTTCRALRCATELQLISGATQRFDEPSALTQVAERTMEFLQRRLSTARPPVGIPRSGDAPLAPREDGAGFFCANSAAFRFKDRRDAGTRLALALKGRPLAGAVVLGIPRGGVVVAHEVAKRLGLELDVIIARKLGAPGHEEFAIGAVTADGTRVLNDEVVRRLDVSGNYLTRVTAEQSAEARRRETLFRAGRPARDLRAQHVIVVDDGLATGATVRAIVLALRHAQVASLMVAVPVGAASVCEELAREVDELVCPYQPDDFGAVGAYYERFPQTADEEVVRLLADANRRQTRKPRGTPLSSLRHGDR